MLARQRPAVGDEQVGAALGQAAEAGAVLGVGQVEQRPHVHAADGGVAVDDRHRSLVAECLAQARQVGAEALDGHGAVLDHGGRPPTAAHGAVDGALQVAPEADDAGVRLGAVDRDDAGRAGNVGRAHQVARGLHLLDGAGVLDEQHGIGAGRDVARRRAADDGAGVDDLDGGRRRRQYRHVGVADRVERVEADDRPGAQVGHRIELDLDLEHQRQRALRAAQEPRQVRPVARQRGQVVAVDAAQDAGPAFLDLGLERVAHGARRGERPVQRGEIGLAHPQVGAVGQQHVQAADAVRRAAVDGGAHAGGVVADHAAEGRAAGRRGVRPEAQAVLAGGRVEVGLDDAGLHAGEPRVGVHRHDLVESRHVEHDAGADGLPGEAGARAAHGERHAVGAAGIERRSDVLQRGGDHDGLRDDPVHGGVGRVRVQAWRRRSSSRP